MTYLEAVHDVRRRRSNAYTRTVDFGDGWKLDVFWDPVASAVATKLYDPNGKQVGAAGLQ